MNPIDAHRKEMLDGAISDYLMDEKVPATQLYDDFVSIVDGWIDYHEKAKQKVSHLKELISGKQPAKSSDLYEEICKSEKLVTNISTPPTDATPEDWKDFWESTHKEGWVVSGEDVLMKED